MEAEDEVGVASDGEGEVEEVRAFVGRKSEGSVREVVVWGVTGWEEGGPLLPLEAAGFPRPLILTTRPRQ